MDWKEDFINAKYHLAVAERLSVTYSEYPEKRILVGIINESGKAVSHLIRAFLIKNGVLGRNYKKNIKIFMERVAPEHLDELTRENLFKVLEIEKAQKKSPIEYAQNDRIILLINGKYRFLTAKRLQELLESISEVISGFPTGIKR
jgi:hypothetical protein